MSDFPNFETLLKMAQNQPDELEKFRQEQIELIIDSAPESCRRRLRGLQFQIDAQRELHADSPLGACVKISQMMHESFTELRYWLNDITGLDDPLRAQFENLEPQEKDTSVVKVLPFPVS